MHASKQCFARCYTCTHKYTHKSAHTCWYRTQHPDSTTPTQHFCSPLHTHTHTCMHNHSHHFPCTQKSWDAWHKMQHLERLLTMDTTSRQHQTHLRLSLIATHTGTCHSHFFTPTHKTLGAWHKTLHLDRLLTTDATSRQHKTHSRLSCIATHTGTHVRVCTIIHTSSLALIKLRVPDIRC